MFGLFACCLGVLLPLGQPAWADPPSDEARAQALFREGVERSRAEDWEAAIAAFQHARALVPRPAVLQNLAVALARAGRSAEALQVLDEYDRLAPTPTPEQAAALKELRDRLTVAHAEPAVSEPPASAPAAVAPNPGASVEPQATAPKPAETEEASPALTLPPPRIEALPDTQARRLEIAAWTTGGTAVVLSGLSLATWLVAGDRADCGDSCTADRHDEVRRLDWTAHVLWGSGAALAIGSGVLWWTAAHRERSKTQLTLSPNHVTLRLMF